MQRPSLAFVAKVRPRSRNETWGGPIVLNQRYGPDCSTDATLRSGVATLQMPKRALSHSSPSRSPTVTWAVKGVIPNEAPARAYTGLKRNPNRWERLSGDAGWRARSDGSTGAVRTAAGAGTSAGSAGSSAW